MQLSRHYNLLTNLLTPRPTSHTIKIVNKPPKPLQNSVTVDNTGVIVIVFNGKQNVDTVRHLTEQANYHLTQLRAKNKKITILVDINNVILDPSDTAGRAETKKLINLDYEVAAVVGPNKYALFLSYLLRGMAHGKKIRFFTNERRARAWLKQAEHSNSTTSLKRPSRFGRAGWLFLIALIAVEVAAVVLWQQAEERNDFESRQAFNENMAQIQKTTEVRLRAYIDTLHGFRGLFRSSDFVSKQDFSSYYQSLDLETNYPGLRSLTYVSAVGTKDLARFVGQMREQGVTPTNGSPFVIKNQTDYPTHFIFTYTSAGASPNIGVDIGSINGRQEIYSNALSSDGIYASGKLDFVATADQPAQPGFFLTTPVVSAVKPEQKNGLVSTVFNYNDFFANLFANDPALQNLNVRFVDTPTNTTVYDSSKAPGAVKYAQTKTIRVANSSWDLTVEASSGYGINATQQQRPLGVLISFQIIAAFLITVFILQWRGRRQALELADTITQDLRHERNLAVANDRKSAAILSSIGDAVFSIDNNGFIQVFNPAAEKISGISEAAALGKHYADVLKFQITTNGKPGYSFIKKALGGHQASMHSHTVLVTPSGKMIPVADSAAPIRDAHNKVVGVIVVFRDISKESDLDKAKSEFVSLASHQLRTPLSAINWYGEMLLGGDAGKLNKMQSQYIKEIFDGSQRMVELVNALLDVSRLEVGKLADQPAPTSINDLIESLEKELQTSIAGKSLTLTKKLEALPLVVADPKQLRMVIQNLMSNAVKYTPAKGTITVTLRTATNADLKEANMSGHQPMWFFSIKDTGYGIPQSQRDKIFGKLFRADNVRKMDVEGTGLGLYIVKQVVEKLGGHVWFDSIESVGTTFSIVAPFGKLPPHEK